MSLIERLENAYETGGISEIVRKGFYYIVYRLHNLHTMMTVRKAVIGPATCNEARDVPVIISLTSYPPRFKQLVLCLKSLCLQDVKPDKIIVYLGSDSTEADITDELRAYEKQGIMFQIDASKNLMSHKKYFYAMQEYPHAIVVTADDDALYPSDWLRSLLDSYERYPHAVSARRVHLMRERDGELLPYNHWKDQCRDILQPSMSLIAIGNGGILYPPNCFDEEAFDVETIQRLCLKADDLWLKIMEIRNALPVVWVKNDEVQPMDIGNPTMARLSNDNVQNRNNDQVLSDLIRHYQIEESVLKEPYAR